MEDKIEYIAVVQHSGIVADDAVETKGFVSEMDAIRWVREIVESAHGEVAYVWNSFFPIKYDLGGEPNSIHFDTSWVMSPGGPTNGFIIHVYP